MPCCGQKREQIAAARYQPPQRHNPARPPAAPAASTGDTVTLLCRDRSVVSVEGPVTGKRYHFTGAGSMQAVDKRDAERLLATNAFQRVWG